MAPSAPPNIQTRGAVIPKGGSKKTYRKNQRKSGRK